VRGHSRTALVGAVTVAAGYAWWATGVRPFTAPAYLAVAGSVVAVAVAGWWSGRHRPPMAASPRLGVRGAAPWLALALAALGLELAGLVLGGRSSRVPTLSMVVDHALAWHGTRLVVFGAWVALGLALVRLRARAAPRRVP
jgi:hypothetical protein